MKSPDEEKDRIIQNAIYCRICQKYLLSKTQHDYVSCKHKMVDGGTSYIRR